MFRITRFLPHRKTFKLQKKWLYDTEKGYLLQQKKKVERAEHFTKMCSTSEKLVFERYVDNVWQVENEIIITNGNIVSQTSNSEEK